MEQDNEVKKPLIDQLTEYVKNNGIQSFTKIVSNAIDFAGPISGSSIMGNRDLFLNHFKYLSKQTYPRP